MSYDFVGLENLQLHIEKISNNNDETFRVDVDILMLDEVFENFVWSDDSLIYDYTKVALIATSNQLLINGISNGTVNPHLDVASKQILYGWNANIDDLSKTSNNDLRRRHKKVLSKNVPRPQTRLQ